MINFDVPSELGIGLSRGSATSLTAGKKVLDYSGRPLNLASRLMDLARPSGVVFDSRFGFNLLDPEMKKRFREDSAYVKGLAESRPMAVYCLDGYTEIPESNKHPLDGFVRHYEPVEKITFKELDERGKYRHRLKLEPARTDNIEAQIWYPKILQNGKKHPTFTNSEFLSAQFELVAGIPTATVDYRARVAELKSRGIKPGWPVSIMVEYSVVPATAE
jgi:hypothetical protein